jgi:hypothetical protein
MVEHAHTGCARLSVAKNVNEELALYEVLYG